ncbi:universal stress protein [Ramlibacter sp. MAHUQ-53]|uniref:universal stress protein n=1 Tax=unclassified Ramlibacter TaxID=2617605 RepID=UPI0036298CC5
MYQCILVATDASALGRKAEQAAIGLAASTGASLVAVHVVPDYPLSLFEGRDSMPPEEVARIEDEGCSRGQAVVDGVVEAAGALGVAARGVLARSDHVADAVLAAARKHGCDLIVMASHGHRGVRRMLLGSETQKVLTHSAIPVLVLR